MRGFLARFVALSIVSGTTIGINKILLTLFGLSLEATNWQLGLIGSAETLGLALGTLPAGLLVSRRSPRALYAVASTTLAGCFLLLPFVRAWIALLPLMLFVGFCISFRIVSMNASFLGQLPALGTGWAGWYKGTLSLGVMALGPWCGNQLTRAHGLRPTFWLSSALFAGMAAFGLLALPPQAGGPRRASPLSRPREWLGPVWADRPVRRACLLEGLSGCCTSFFGTFMLVILVRDHGWARDRAVSLLVVYGSVYVAVLLGAGWLLARTDGARLDRFVYGGIAAALVGLGLAGGAASLFAWTAVFSLGLGFNNLINVTTISASRCDRGHVSGLSTLTQMLGGCLGTFLGGLLSALAGLQPLFLLFALPWLAVLVLEPARMAQRSLTPHAIARP
jgi:predicted MFS family arabinose efflux permease